MYGKNKVSKQDLNRPNFLVNSVFYTIQGEGPDAGRPAAFVRLSGCNLRCSFCDTDFEDAYEAQLDTLVDDVRTYSSKLVCITGGEPLLQNILPLVDRLNQLDLEVTVETAGTVFLPGMEKYFAANRSIHGNLVVCSPKTPRLAEPLIPLIGAYKYVVRAGGTAMSDGLPITSSQIDQFDDRSLIYRPKNKDVPIYIQPVDEGDYSRTNRNLNHAALICMTFGYRLSLQLHKILGLD